MGRRNIVHPVGTPETSGIPTYIDLGYGDGHNNTVSKGYTNKYLVNGHPWDEFKWDTAEGNCDLPAPVRWGKYRQYLKPLYADTYTEHVPISQTIFQYNYQDQPDRSLDTPLIRNFIHPVEGPKLLVVHPMMGMSNYGYYAHYAHDNTLRFFRIIIDGQQYTINQLLENEMIEPLVLLNRGGHGISNVFNSVLEVESTTTGVTGEGISGYGYTNTDGTYSPRRQNLMSGVTVVLTLKEGTVVDGIAATAIMGYSNTINHLECYEADLNDLRFSLYNLA